jgi:orotidine-5'-phosphate decarboxylase
MKAKDRIIVALDTPSLETAGEQAGRLFDHVGLFKVGLELICHAGLPEVLYRLQHFPLMVDLKLADIPNTMRGAIRALGELKAQHPQARGGPKFVTVHASAGSAGLLAAVEEADKHDIKVLAVTVLTSIDEGECYAVFGRSPEEQVENMAHGAYNAGCLGVVCSPEEAPLIRKHYPHRDLTIVTPGVRPTWASKDDQARVATPKLAISRGADYVVVGRPILQPPAGMTPLEASISIASDIADGELVVE